MYEGAVTIKKTLDKIDEGQFVLPAIQREFVWKADQICKFFDSLMQGYPFGTFLYWHVKTENIDKFKFYEFMLDYHERDHPYCLEKKNIKKEPLTAVLDGQQRLTALNIGLRGTMSWKLPHKRLTSPDAFPERELYLDLLSDGERDENGVRYKFSFLNNKKLDEGKGEHCWFRAKLVWEKGDDLVELLNMIPDSLDSDKRKHAQRVLGQFFNVVHNRNLVSSYEEKEQDLEKVLNIFIRMNSGGTELSYSDLLLSIAVAQWEDIDARKEIRKLVDEINRIGDGFNFSRDLVLKAGLMMSVENVAFKVENFNKENMARLENNWEKVREALLFSVELIASFGFSGRTIRADSAILPVAFYSYHRQLEESYLRHKSYEQDRKNIREWFVRSLLKSSGIWGSGLDSLLTALRNTIKNHDANDFPYSKIKEVMAHSGKPIHFEADEIEDLADISYGDNRLFSMMSLIFPFIKDKHEFHIDHIFPKKHFTNSDLQKSFPESSKEKIEQIIENSNRIANLQLLIGAKNKEKNKKMPLRWLEEDIPKEEQESYARIHLLDGLSNCMTDFPNFYDKRREIIKEEIAKILNVK